MTKNEVKSEPHQIAKQVTHLLGNRQALIDKYGFKEALYTPPSRDHYPHIYLWDSCFSAIIYAQHGYTREAVTELFTVVNGQRPDGMIPNMQFSQQGRKFDVERQTFMYPKLSSDYTQPPEIAKAAKVTYDAMYVENNPSAEVFLSELFPYLDSYYKYLADNRQNSSTDKLVGVIHPHETGRDSDPTFDFIKKRLERKGKDTPRLINEVNRASDYASVIVLNIRHRLKKWDVIESRKNFWVNDVMFNCMYTDNLYKLAEIGSILGKAEDASRYNLLANEVEQQILKDMWLEDENGQMGFFALTPEGPIKEVSISNLFPLLLPNLREDQLRSILSLMETSFNTRYPLPSVATTSRNYDPEHGERDRLWRGPTWINTNWLIEGGMRMQASRDGLTHWPDLITDSLRWADRIAKSSDELTKQGYFEFHSPENGRPHRTNRVRDFAWSALSHGSH